MINTVSGDNGTTAISRVYASNDQYIRYYSLTNFNAQRKYHYFRSCIGYANTCTPAPCHAGDTDLGIDGSTGTGNWMNFIDRKCCHGLGC
jgi:hypothetical protein